jgi:hypothetical protein
VWEQLPEVPILTGDAFDKQPRAVLKEDTDSIRRRYD